MLPIERIRAFFKKDVFASNMGIEIEQVDEDGGAVCKMALTPAHMNAGGAPQGGAILRLQILHSPWLPILPGVISSPSDAAFPL